ncbi:phospholipid/cholesterol/gamma-HCH transport system substrate-binding protein [Jatrophihabitans sp. GAS493]|uniref:MCE family protein n=1 Tax=Jatrophihabitans sp. GAS493 TaxID=1907575 RepID=UPI000BC07EF0|nr:MCE family protein [Jatrophihabitans sp. GAS493]SOD72375.1 phospholipid/cholesterol/gamma-HCH transport system substrate-binding protein [Jatrophihabitans sp. GAS493]
MTSTTPMKTRKAPGGRSFSSRNPTTIGAIGLVLIAVLLWSAFNAQKLPIIGGGTIYYAAFSEAAGIKPNDEVRIAGVKVGLVTGVALDGDHVKITFRVKQAYVGNESTAAIKIKTLLGAKFLAINPVGGSRLKAGSQIPLTRTVAPYDIYPTFQQLTNTVEAIDKEQLAKSFQVLSQSFDNTPADVKIAITGLSKLSSTFASRDAALRSLLAKTKSVSGVLADRDTQITQLITDGGLLLDELNSRKDAIQTLLENTAVVSAQLSGLVADNNADLKPALDQLNAVLAILNQNKDSLARGLQLIAPYYRLFTNVTGNGRWFSGYVRNATIGDLTISGFTPGAD